MRPVKLGWIILLILLMAGSASGYYLYSKQKTQLEKNAKSMEEIKTLRDQQTKIMESSSNSGEMSEEELAVLRLLAETKGDMWFLEDIEERIDKNLLPTFSFIGPLKQQDLENHIQFTRELNILATFAEFNTLLEELEKNRGFIISQLNINKGSTQDSLSVKFQLSCIKIKENFLTQLGTRPNNQNKALDNSLVMDFPWQEDSKIDLNSKVADPFEKYVPKPVVVVDTTPKILPPIDLSGKYTLQGIVVMADQKIALIAPDQLFVEGDFLDDMKIMKIEDNRMDLEKDSQPYFIKLPGDIDFGTKGKNATK